jgi:hypothetical protein
MSTTKPRITLTLEPRAYEIVRRLAAANGASMSSTITEFLDVALPPMERLVVVLEQAVAMPEATRQQVRDSIGRAEAKLLPALAGNLAQMDFLIEATGREIERAVQPQPERRSRDGGGGTKRGGTPGLVTRGSGPQKRPIKGAKNGRL